MKILTVVGARPQFIKAAAVSRTIGQQQIAKEILVHTGQHYDDKMSQVFFDELEIPKPDYNLEVGSSTHGKQTGQMLERLEQVMLDEQPNVVLVYGDTNSTLAAALAATKLHIPLAHVEAGLRSFNRKMPEEINRVVTDHIADALYTPTEAANANLQNEGIHSDKIIFAGDVMYDVSLYYAERMAANPILETLGTDEKSYALLTIHRQENTDNPQNLANIVSAITDIGEQLPVIFPCHPRTAKTLKHHGFYDSLSNVVKFIEPVGYLDMLTLERQAKIVITDSGGVQKEAYFHRVPCLTLRESTEWIELVESGWNCLADPGTKEAIVAGFRQMTGAEFNPETDLNLYGGGTASRRIVEDLIQRFSSQA